MQNLVNKISETNTVSIKWMPGHEGHLGNEIADRLAKLGAQLQTDGAEPRLAVSQCVIKEATEKWFKNQHEQSWQNRTDCRQTRLVLPTTGHRWEKCTKYLNRNEMRILTQVATGHGCLRRHMHIMGLSESPNCELCGMEQTPIHVITICPALCGQRVQILNRPTLTIEMIRDYNPSRMVRFAIATDS